jgi:hypothetical protein
VTLIPVSVGPTMKAAILKANPNDLLHWLVETFFKRMTNVKIVQVCNSAGLPSFTAKVLDIISKFPSAQARVYLFFDKQSPKSANSAS